MFARVSIIEGSPDRLDESIRQTQGKIIPEAKKMHGFKGLYQLIDRKTGKGMAITLWETETDLKASTEAANRLRAQASETLAATQPPRVEIYEVAIQP